MNVYSYYFLVVAQYTGDFNWKNLNFDYEWLILTSQYFQLVVAFYSLKSQNLVLK